MVHASLERKAIYSPSTGGALISNSKSVGTVLIPLPVLLEASKVSTWTGSNESGLFMSDIMPTSRVIIVDVDELNGVYVPVKNRRRFLAGSPNPQTASRLSFCILIFEPEALGYVAPEDLSTDERTAVQHSGRELEIAGTYASPNSVGSHGVLTVSVELGKLSPSAHDNVKNNLYVVLGCRPVNVNGFCVTVTTVASPSSPSTS